jgi:hypothetical protein
VTVIIDEIVYKIVYHINLETSDGRLEKLSDYLALKISFSL